KRMPRSRCQLRVRDPQILLLLPLLARAHRHALILRTNPVDTPELSAYESRLTPRAANRLRQREHIVWSRTPGLSISVSGGGVRFLIAATNHAHGLHGRAPHKT